MKRKQIFMGLVLLVLILSACGKNNSKIPVSGEKMDTIQAPIINSEGNQIGEIRVSEEEDGVVLTIQAEGLTPGIHGVHIHETGVCTPPDFKSAGGHFNPEAKEHGFENPKGFHLGDLPNIEVDAEGTVQAKLKIKGLTLKKGSETSLVDKDGSSLVIHADPDDYKTNPAGNSGERVACAVIAK